MKNSYLSVITPCHVLSQRKGMTSYTGKQGTDGEGGAMLNRHATAPEENGGTCTVRMVILQSHCLSIMSHFPKHYLTLGNFSIYIHIYCHYYCH